MSLISMSGLTLGYLTWPLASADGWPPGLVRTGTIGAHRPERDRPRTERAVDLDGRLEFFSGGSEPSCAVRSALASFGDDAHAPGLGAQARRDAIDFRSHYPLLR
jgi:hypothetical protein